MILEQGLERTVRTIDSMNKREHTATMLPPHRIRVVRMVTFSLFQVTRGKQERKRILRPAIDTLRHPLTCVPKVILNAEFETILPFYSLSSVHMKPWLSFSSFKFRSHEQGIVAASGHPLVRNMCLVLFETGPRHAIRRPAPSLLVLSGSSCGGLLEAV
jgi:hypothetical protein